MVLFHNKLIDSNNVIELNTSKIGVLIFTRVSILESTITIYTNVLKRRILQERKFWMDCFLGLVKNNQEDIQVIPQDMFESVDQP